MGIVKQRRDKIDGPSSTTAYRKWASMMRSAVGMLHPYSYQEDNTKRDYICPEWRNFDNFRRWYDAQNAPEGASMFRRNMKLGFFPENVYIDTCSEARKTAESTNRSYSRVLDMYKLGLDDEAISAVPVGRWTDKRKVVKNISLNANTIPVSMDGQEAIAIFTAFGDIHYALAYGTWDEEYGGNKWLTTTHGTQREAVCAWFDVKCMEGTAIAFREKERLMRKHGRQADVLKDGD